jgi:hypothetical protein
MYYGKTLDFNSSVSLDPIPKATAKKIRKISQEKRCYKRILLRIMSCVEKAKHWDDLSPREDNVEDRMGRFIISVTVDRKLPDYAEYKISIKRTNPRRG